MLGKDQITVPDKVIERLREWNTIPEKSTREYDERAVIALLLVSASADDIIAKKISTDIKAFIKGTLSIIFIVYGFIRILACAKTRNQGKKTLSKVQTLNRPFDSLETRFKGYIKLHVNLCFYFI